MEQDRLIREHAFFPERGHREFKLVDRQAENVARLPVMANDQGSDIGFPATRKVGANFCASRLFVGQHLEARERKIIGTYGTTQLSAEKMAAFVVL